MLLTHDVDADVTLTLHSYDDAEQLHRLFQRNRATLLLWSAWGSDVQSMSDLTSAVQDDLRAMARGEAWAWLVRYRGQLAGRIRLQMTHMRQREGTLSFWLGRAYEGREIMLRALQAVIDWCFTELNLHRLCIDTEPEQTPSQQLAQQLGFQYEARLRNVIYRDGQARDWLRYSLLTDEWTPREQTTFGYAIDETATLRLLQKHHASLEYALIDRNRDEMRRWFSWAASHSLKTERAFLQHVLDEYAVGRSLTLGIWQQRQLVGQVALTIAPRNGHAQVGYFLDREARGSGLVTRSVSAMMTWTFARRRLNRVWLRAAVDNQPSIAVAERLGMQREGVLRHENRIDGRWVNHAVYSMVAADWRAQQRARADR